MATGDYENFRACNCTLPYFNPGACERCCNRNLYPQIIPNAWTYVPAYKPTKTMIETWKDGKHIIEEKDEQGNEKKTTEEFDSQGRLIKRTTEETKAIPETTYVYPVGNGTSSISTGTVTWKTTTDTTILNEENITST